MAKREFNWIGYDVAVPALLAQRMRTFVTAPQGAIELALAAEAPSTVQVEIKLPDLAEYPTPRSKAKILLESAAEVEHALMVQYLYAAYSLKASDEVDPANADVLDETIESSWPQTLRAIAREEMGHFMTVQNLLMLLGLDPNFEREDSPFRGDLYPFRLKLQPLTQASLAKYVVAEAPGDAEGIGEIIDIAEDKTGSTINRVGILYGLLGAVFSRQDQISGGATGHPEWDDIVRVIAKAAYKQDGVREHWHLSDGDFHIETLSRQADPDDWQVGQLRVHRVADRGAAENAIRDIGEQGEGPSGGGPLSHFERFLRIFKEFPKPEVWVPTRPVPTEPTINAVTNERTRRWAELANARYALLLGFIDHYLHATADVRRVLVGWIIAEMRSRLGFIARELTAMPLSDNPASTEVAACLFTLPPQLTLPDDESARWRVHLDRTTTAIGIAQQLRDGPQDDRLGSFLARLLSSDQARLATMKELATTTSFARDIQPLFRPKDLEHMEFFADFADLEEVKASAQAIIDKLELDDGGDESGDRMPVPPDPRWTPAQVQLLRRWIADDCPP